MFKKIAHEIEKLGLDPTKNYLRNELIALLNDKATVNDEGKVVLKKNELKQKVEESKKPAKEETVKQEEQQQEEVSPEMEEDKSIIVAEEEVAVENATTKKKTGRPKKDSTK